MMGNIEIRKAQIGDEKSCAYIQTESWKKAFIDILSEEELNMHTDIRKTEEMYTKVLKNHFVNGLILSVDEKPHCIAFWSESREENMLGYAELICIHSLQENWGKGYGSVMMKYVLNEMKSFGFEKAMLWMFEENGRAQKFYEKHGFSFNGKKKEFGSALEVMYCIDLKKIKYQETLHK